MELEISPMPPPHEREAVRAALTAALPDPSTDGVPRTWWSAGIHENVAERDEPEASATPPRAA